MRKPQYRHEIERLGEELGTNGDQLLQEVRGQARSPQYPSSDCYFPDEVLTFERTGSLPADRLGHMESCVGCRALLQTLVPNPDLVREFREEVMRNRAQEQMAAISTQPADSKIDPVWEQVLSPGRPAAAVAALIFVLIAGVFWLNHQHGNKDHTSMASIPSPSPALPKGVAGSSVAIAHFTNTSSPTTVQLKRKVKLKSKGYFAPDSWPTIAATAAIYEGALRPSDVTPDKKDGFINISLPENDVQAVSNAVASAYQPLAEIDKAPQYHLFSLSLQKKLEALKDKQGKNVSYTHIAWDEKNDEIRLLNNDRPVAVIFPDNTLNMSRQYQSVLRVHDGAADELDKAMPNVTLSFTPDTTGKKSPN
ncbi:MAG: hypothetical protein ACJ71W_17895 [Terriglobales bacterium]